MKINGAIDGLAGKTDRAGDMLAVVGSVVCFNWNGLLGEHRLKDVNQLTLQVFANIYGLGWLTHKFKEGWFGSMISPLQE